ncbi:hypothetical protein IGI04_036411, partial [Brassica rapa subsp. trilocularis]
MENTERDQPSIDGDTFPSSDVESEKSTDTELPTSNDATQPEAVKFSLTKPANEKVVQTELNGQTSNEASQTEQGTEIPVKENSTLTKGEDINLSIQDYLDPEIKNSLKSFHSFVQNKHRSDIAQIDDNALSDPNDYLDEGTNYSDPYSNRKTTAEKAKEKAIDLELEEDTEIADEIDRYISDRTDDYMRLMDASIEVANVEENDDSE